MPGKVIIDLKHIRAAIAKAAKDLKSVRRVATEVGLSYTALRWFIAGGKPQAESRRRLVAWYLAHRSVGGGPTASELEVAVQLLAARVGRSATPALKRKRARELIRAVLKELDDDAQRAIRDELLGS